MSVWHQGWDDWHWLSAGLASIFPWHYGQRPGYHAFGLREACIGLQGIPEGSAVKHGKCAILTWPKTKLQRALQIKINTWILSRNKLVASAGPGALTVSLERKSTLGNTTYVWINYCSDYISQGQNCKGLKLWNCQYFWNLEMRTCKRQRSRWTF